MPIWLFWLSIISLIVASACALIIILDERKYPQPMWIMNIVWPVTTLYFGPIGLWAYWRWGRSDSPRWQKTFGEPPKKSFPAIVAVGDSHCGAGCTLGDIIGGWLVFTIGLEISGLALWPELLVDYALAFTLGVLFQYFTIVPMRKLGVRDGIVAALKADAISLTAFEVGLFGWMILMQLVFFPVEHVQPNQPTYWFLMQIGMILGFFTAYPVNWWLIRIGVKEQM